MVPGVTRDRHMRSRCRCSMCPAIHTNSRSWLRSSSTHEPSDPPLRVVFQLPAFGHIRPGNTGRDQGGEESHRADSHHPRFGITTSIKEHKVSGRTCGTASSTCSRPSLTMEDPTPGPASSQVGKGKRHSCRFATSLQTFASRGRIERANLPTPGAFPTY